MRAFLRATVAIFVLFFCWARPTLGADTWTEVRSPHFRVVGNAGEKSERHVADQFEEMRDLFQRFLPKFHVDPGKPFIIIALKNEDAMKAMLPDYWAAKDRAHPAGMFISGFDENLVILRTDVNGTGENPYHLVYHEYTHAIMRLNVHSLPVWLNEGLAEFYGNTHIGEHETEVGRVSPGQISILQRSTLIPITQLMGADARSPFYNERNQATIFYAESWAIVHYLMLDPEARKQEYFSKYLEAWLETYDGEAAAKSVFGDLNKFQERIDHYAHQMAFYFVREKLQESSSSPEDSTRSMTPAEVLATQADFLLHTAHVNDARRLLEQAAGQQPDLAAVHECMGLLQYMQYNNDESTKEFAKAAELDPHDFRPSFYQAEIILRKSGYSATTTPQIVSLLEKALELNPGFAPTHAFLSVAYRQGQATKEKALDAAKQANHRAPTVLAYAADVGYALMALGRDAEARSVGEQINKAAKSPQEKAVAQSYAKQLAHHEELAQKKQNDMPASSSDPSENSEEETSSPASSESDRRSSSGVASEDGLIQAVDCSPAPGAKMKFAILGKTLALSIGDVAKVEIRTGGKTASSETPSCSQWSGRKAKITFRSSSDGTSDGEIVAIEFF